MNAYSFMVEWALWQWVEEGAKTVPLLTDIYFSGMWFRASASWSPYLPYLWRQQWHPPSLCFSHRTAVCWQAPSGAGTISEGRKSLCSLLRRTKTIKKVACYVDLIWKWCNYDVIDLLVLLKWSQSVTRFIQTWLQLVNRSVLVFCLCMFDIILFMLYQLCQSVGDYGAVCEQLIMKYRKQIISESSFFVS